LEQVLVGDVRGEHHDGRLRHLVRDLDSGLDAPAGHLYVEKTHVGAMLHRERHRRGTVTDVGDDLHPRSLEDTADARARRDVIVGK